MDGSENLGEVFANEGVELPAIKNHLPSVTADEVKTKIEKGLRLPKDVTILHTSPHHDDLELAYLPYLQQLVRSKNVQNHFAYCTSSYTSATSDYLLSIYRNLLKGMEPEAGDTCQENLALMFDTCYLSQRDAEFPSYEYNVTFKVGQKPITALSRSSAIFPALLRNLRAVPTQTVSSCR